MADFDQPSTIPRLDPAGDGETRSRPPTTSTSAQTASQETRAWTTHAGFRNGLPRSGIQPGQIRSRPQKPVSQGSKPTQQRRLKRDFQRDRAANNARSIRTSPRLRRQLFFFFFFCVFFHVVDVPGPRLFAIRATQPRWRRLQPRHSLLCGTIGPFPYSFGLDSCRSESQGGPDSFFLSSQFRPSRSAPTFT